VGNTDVHLFEIANCFPGSAAGHLPDEYVELGMVSTGEIAPLRGALETVVQRLAPGAQITVRSEPAPHLAAGTAAAVLMNGEPIGTIGRVAQAVQDHYGLEKPIASAAVRFEAILHAACLTRTYQPVPKFPPVRRDLSIIVDDGVTWQELSDVISGLPQPLREGLEYVTTYRGKPIPAGRKSVTVTLSFRAADRTLRGEEVDEQIEQVLAALRGKFRAELRT
jgi:phenylalanyl-tRNA synthetase beta chain